MAKKNSKKETPIQHFHTEWGFNETGHVDLSIDGVDHVAKDNSPDSTPPTRDDPWRNNPIDWDFNGSRQGEFL